MPIANMCICAFILRNALSAMVANNTSEYFECMPPTFEEWVAEGPRLFDVAWTNVDIENI